MSKLLNAPVRDEKVVIGEYRADIEADHAAEKKLATVYLGINVVTTVEGRKMIPIQELLKIDKQLVRERQQAYNQGFSDGHKKGLDTGHQEARKVIDNFAGLIKDAVSQREVLYEEAHRKILELVLKIARKVTFGAAQIDPDVTAKIISGTIEKLVDKSKIKVKVRPEHLPMIEQQIERFMGESTAVKEISIEPDVRVRFGGCFIETPTGDVDARVDSQLDIISEEIGNLGDQS
ncbi:MAG: FliH/SctL family protein [Candidatus Zixiibacteriota bacterium]